MLVLENIFCSVIQGNLLSPFIGYQDIKATEIIIPQDTTLRWTNVAPRLVFTNLGDQTDTFSIRLIIVENLEGDTVYKEEEQVWPFLKTGVTDTIVFTSWCPEEIGNSYRAIMVIDYYLDQNPSNDSLFRNPILVQCGDTSKYDTLHNLTAAKFNHLDEKYLENRVEIKPELIIANIGNHNEPDSGFSSKIKLLCVTKDHRWNQNDTLYDEIQYLEHISKIGYHGQDTFPDTIPFVFTWTPQGDTEAQYVWNPENIGTHYEIIGLVQLGVVGPEESDHYPYNDTIRIYRTCLFSDDVGLWGFELLDHKTGRKLYNGNIPQGTQIDSKVMLYNCGYHSEKNIRVVLQIQNYNGNWKNIWVDTVIVSNLDWRGESDSYRKMIVFPTYTIKQTESLRLISCAELDGDECPYNNSRGRYMGAVEEKPEDKLSFSLDVKNLGRQISVCYTIPKTTDLSLKIYNVSGELVSTLVENTQKEGSRTIFWSGLDDHQKKLPRGIYLIRMESKEFSVNKKIILYN